MSGAEVGPPRGRRGHLLAVLAACESELDRHNVLPAGALAMRLARMRALLLRGRLARVAAVGRRGAGKSTLLNTVAGGDVAHVGDVEDATAGVAFHEVRWGERRVEWYDTPGLRAGGEPGRARRVAAGLSIAPPDVLLFLCQATEVDAGLSEELVDLRTLLAELTRAAGRPPYVVAVVTKVDEVDPVDVPPPFDDDEKRARVREAVALLGRRLRAAGVAPVATVPVCAYVRYDRGRVVESMRWNVDALIDRVSALLGAVGEPLGAPLPGELRAALTATMDALTDAFVSRASLVASGRARPAPVAGAEAEIAQLRATLVRLLRALAPTGLEAPRRDGPAGVLGLLRAGTSRLGARTISGALAAADLRARASATARDVLAVSDDAAFRALFVDDATHDASTSPPVEPHRDD